MKADLKKKWIRALRSGKYTQGYGRLENNGVFCCLGVLCKVAGVKYYGHDAVAPSKLLDTSLQNILIDMNDGTKSKNSRHTFNEIADWIEKEVLEE